MKFTGFALLIIFEICSCQDVRQYFEDLNKNIAYFNAIGSKIAWKSAVDPTDPELPGKSSEYQKRRIAWQQNACTKLVSLNEELLLNDTQRRQMYLMCRGPKYSIEEARTLSTLYEQLQSMYADAKICLPTNTTISNSLQEQETAIENFLTNVKTILKIEENELTRLAAKIVVAGKLEEDNVVCLKGESDFEKLMRRSSKEYILRWVWLVWREKVGPLMKEPYRMLVKVQNEGARRNGYPNIGASWRDDLEIVNLRELCHQLYDEVRPLYSLLHGVVRFFLRRQYGEMVPERGLIPAHLLGDLWSQNWETVADLITPRKLEFNENIKRLNWTVLHMVKHAEDFYRSLGLPAMTDTFWRESVFSSDDVTRCHGTAADMFKDGDYRLLYCSGTSFEDLYVLHHEMGHIQYYMAYKDQPGIFRQANAAFHETIGETIMLGVMTPQHLHRLGLINDSELYTSYKPDDNDYYFDIDIDIDDDMNIIEDKQNHYNYGTNDYGKIKTKKHLKLIDNRRKTTDTRFTTRENFGKISEHHYDRDVRNMNAETKDGWNVDVDINSLLNVTTDEILMLKMALNKIPQIPFAFLTDEYRWKYFEGSLDNKEQNKAFWDMASQLQGIAPPSIRSEEYFDIGAKFHVPDNTPYIRYFLSSFLQHQLYESLCKAAVFGRRGVSDELPPTITMNRCDIYGSKAVGKLLKDFMSRGDSQTWKDILKATTGKDQITASALKRYYRPIYRLLMRIVRVYDIPIGW